MSKKRPTATHFVIAGKLLTRAVSDGASFKRPCRLCRLARDPLKLRDMEEYAELPTSLGLGIMEAPIEGA